MQLKVNLKKLISERGISIKFLSKETKVPLQTIHNCLNGTEPRSLGQLKRVADYFQVSLDFICFGIKNPTPLEQEVFEKFDDQIYAGIFEVVLRRINNKNNKEVQK